MFFWGLNGFFNWVKIPPESEVIDSFVEACIKTRFIMPTVKILEIITGALITLGFFVPMCLLLLAPIIFVISFLHLLHNKKPWGVLLTTTFPYLVLVGLHLSDF